MATQPTIGKRTICCSRLISVALLLTMLLGVGQMTKAQQDLANQRPDLVFAHYEEAWQAAQAALGVVLAASEPAEDVIADDLDHVHDDLDGEDATGVQQLFLPLIAR